MKQFAPRFIDGHARANRQKPSGIAAKELLLRVHLVPFLGHKRLDAITNEDVQRLKAWMVVKAPKTVNNVLAVLSVLLKKAVEWEVDRSDALHDPVAADSKAVGEHFTTSTSTNDWSRQRGRLDRITAADRAPGRRGRLAVRRDDRPRVEGCGS